MKVREILRLLHDDGWQLVNGTSGSFTTIDDSSAVTEPRPGDLFSEVSWFAVLYGQGLVPTGHHPIADTLSEDDLELTLSRIRAAIRERVASLPSHADYIRSCCAAEPATTAA